MVHQLFIDSEKVCDSLRREILYSIHFEFCIHVKLVVLSKMFK